jgi:hypothetical protein
MQQQSHTFDQGARQICLNVQGYFVVDQCDNPWNKALAVAGAKQPWTHSIPAHMPYGLTLCLKWQQQQNLDAEVCGHFCLKHVAMQNRGLI